MNDALMGRLSKPAVALALTLLLFAGGGAYALGSANGGTITVCVNHKTGTLYKANKCARHDNRLSWNQQGPQGPKGAKGEPGSPGANGANGKDGTSVTSQPVASGGPTCPSGGSSFTEATGTTYACNGAPGSPGANGTNGKDGTSVTSQALASGDANCPNGGSSFTAANGTTYGCNGAPGSARDVGAVGPGTNPGFFSQGFRGWRAVSQFATGRYCLTPDATSTIANAGLVVSLGGPGSTAPGYVAWTGYCTSNPLVFEVETFDTSGALSNAIAFTATIP